MHPKNTDSGLAVSGLSLPYLNESDLKALNRFVECCDDPGSGGHDVPAEQMRRLRNLGVVTGSKFHALTAFGLYVHSAAPQHHLPLATLDELNAREATLHKDRLRFSQRPDASSPATESTLSPLPAPRQTGPDGEALYTAEEMISFARASQLANHNERDVLYKVRDYAEEYEHHELHNMVTAVLYRGEKVGPLPAAAETAREDAIRWAQIQYRNDDTVEGRELAIAIAAWTAALRIAGTAEHAGQRPTQPYFLIGAKAIEQIHRLLGRVRQRDLPATAGMIADLLPDSDFESVSLEALASASVRTKAFEDLLFRFAREAIPVSDVAEMVDVWHTQTMLAGRSLAEKRYARVRQPERHFELINKCLWKEPDQFDKAVDNMGDEN
jgi:hypothetical protein